MGWPQFAGDNKIFDLLPKMKYNWCFNVTLFCVLACLECFGRP